MKTLTMLDRTDLFIIDHAIRAYMKRAEALEADLERETDLLDRINEEIYKSNARKARLNKDWKHKK